MNREIDSLEYLILKYEEQLEDLNPNDPEIEYLESEINRFKTLRDNLIENKKYNQKNNQDNNAQIN